MASEELASFDRTVRAEIYARWIKTGGAPQASEIAQALNRDVAATEASFQRLAAAKVLTLAPITGTLWMVHPFSAVPTPYRVRTTRRAYWANCAWDALGVAAMIGQDATIIAQCPDCGEQIDLSVRSGVVASNIGLVHFVVPPRQFWDNVAFT